MYRKNPQPLTAEQNSYCRHNTILISNLCFLCGLSSSNFDQTLLLPSLQIVSHSNENWFTHRRMNGFLKISSPNFDSQIVTKMNWSDVIGIWVTLLWEQIWNSFYRRWYLQHIFCPSWETRSKLTTDWFLEKVFLKNYLCPAMSPLFSGEQNHFVCKMIYR